MADAVVLFGVQKLWELLSQESDGLQGVDEQVDELKRQLETLQSLLEDADAKKHDSKRVRNFLEDVKDIVYDAEDTIENFLLKEESGKEKGFRKRVKRLACFLMDQQKMASNIRGFTLRISEVVARMQSFGIQKIINGVRSLSLQERRREQREIRQAYPNNSETNLVGVEQSVEELVGHLVENDTIQMVSVSGMGGSGKTTLAIQVFHHEIVRRHFDGFAWVCVSQQFTQKQVWRVILQYLRPQDNDIIQMDENTLQVKLSQLLETGRYLIVLDDVWKKEDWDRIKAAFPQKLGNWKMLLTSRNEGVGLHADPTCFPFRPRLLTPQESWKLCEKMVFPNREKNGTLTDLRVAELEVMGKKMVTHCGGLPLAVKVLGGLLATKHTVPQWKRVCDNIGAHIVGGSGSLDDNSLNSVYRVLSLSYEDLPMNLKHCFLYLAHFPEHYKIDVETLFNYWAAEGLLMSFYDEATIQDNGEGCLEELVKRNMVIAETSYSSSRIEYCQMHDIMREVCLSKAKEENFLQVVKVPSRSPSRCRRLAVHSGNALHMLGPKSKSKVRSLLYFGVDEDVWIQSNPHFRSSRFLRVLDLSRVMFEGGKLPSSIGELIHLRFLRLYEAGISYLPSSLRNLKLLLYLNLYVDDRISLHVPNVLKEMLNLRYLYLPMSMHDDTKLELDGLVNLETLWFFSTKHSKVTDLLRMTKLRVLNVCFTAWCNSESLSSSLGNLRNLEALSLYDLQENRVTYHGREIVLDFKYLKALALAMHMPKLFDQYRFPSNLAHISLFYCGMEEDPMPFLEKLLHLKSVVLKYGAFVGTRMVCSKSGFPQLYSLELHGQDNLKSWRIDEGSMTCLRTLIIIDCKNLMKLPVGIKYITSLKELQIEEMKREWTEKLVLGGEDYYKVQHIPSVQFINCDQYTENEE